MYLHSLEHIKITGFSSIVFESFTVAWLTVPEYCYVCRNHNPVLSSLMTYQRVLIVYLYINIFVSQLCCKDSSRKTISTE